MKKIIMNLCVLLIIFSIFFTLTIPSEAVTSQDIKDSFSGSTTGTGGIGTGRNAVKNIVGTILDITRTIGATVAVVILMTIAAKYIMASAGDRADIKKYAVNYVIGAMILFSASAILGIVKGVVDDSFGS